MKYQILIQIIILWEHILFIIPSIAQYIKKDDKYIYRLDHGDGTPRAVSLSRISQDGSLDDVTDLYYSLYDKRFGILRK